MQDLMPGRRKITDMSFPLDQYKKNYFLNLKVQINSSKQIFPLIHRLFGPLLFKKKLPVTIIDV